VYVVDFQGVSHFGSSDSIDVQVQLHEQGNIIEMHFTNAATDGDGIGETVGIEDPTGQVAYTWINFEDDASEVGTALRFTPIPLVNEVDSDGDGYLTCDDCNDGIPNIFPGASETCDGLDNNCDGDVDEGCPE